MGKIWRSFVVLVLVINIFSCSSNTKGYEQRIFETQMEDGLKIVVIGSSTAAGAGPERLDSAWAFRLKKSLKRKNPRNKLINLARGGYTSFHLLPNDSEFFNVTIHPDTNRNISKAIALKPDIILMNLPSNDNTKRIPLKVQLRNLKLIIEKAEINNIPIWITTTQPVARGRNMAFLQRLLKDSIVHYFNPHVIDFWNGLADKDGKVLDTLNAGDGIHLNEYGHRLLFSRVVNSVNIDSLYTNKQM